MDSVWELIVVVFDALSRRPYRSRYSFNELVLACITDKLTRRWLTRVIMAMVLSDSVASVTSPSLL